MSGALIRHSSSASNYESVRILVVEDEPKLGRLLVRGLGEEGHPADLAPSGEEALWMARAAPYDAIVLDVMLPGIDGFATCRELRSRGVWTPVLMLTARDAIDDRISGFDTGADDYPVKPFAFSEPRALCGRSPGARRRKADRARVGDLRLDPATHRAWRRIGLDLTARTRAPRSLHAPPGEVPRGCSSSTLPGTSRSSHSNVGRLHPLPAGEIDRPFAKSSLERSAASGTG
jgi:DNA-binding response OmpR family regulator